MTVRSRSLARRFAPGRSASRERAERSDARHSNLPLPPRGEGWGGGLSKDRLLSRLGIAALCLVATAGCRASGEKPGFVVMPEMYHSVSYKPYDANPVTRNGQTLQLPPEGTVALGSGPFAYGPGPQEAQRAGRELVNPLAGTREDLKRGRKVFETVCIVCHGPKGEGDGPVIGRFPNPPSLLAARARALPDGQIVHIIARGQGIMPAHAVQVIPEDRWRVALYLRQLQRAAAAGGQP